MACVPTTLAAQQYHGHVNDHDGEEQNDHHFDREMLLLDSGAECCVCPETCAPECPTEQLSPEKTPTLVTVTGGHAVLQD